MLFWLLVAHAVADYPLQGDFLAKAKNHKTPIPGVPWAIALMAHSMIHAGAVALVTGSVDFGMSELCAHCIIDYRKCDGRTSFTTDQALHLACKVVFVALLFGPRAMGYVR
jgi:hypothetical protein